MTNTTFDKRFNAQRAARRALKMPEATEGVDFQTFKNAAGAWEWTSGRHVPEKAISVNDPKLADHPIAKKNAASWPSGPKKRAKGAKVHNLAAEREARKGGKKARKAQEGSTEPKRGMSMKYRLIHAEATKGILPPKPPFPAGDPAYKPYQKKLNLLVAMIERGDLAGLMAYPLKPYDSAAVQLVRFRDFSIAALKAQVAGGRKLTEMTSDEWEIQQINEATEFTATKSLGRGNYDTRRFATLEQAGRGAYEMGNGTIVYAVTPKGRQVMVGGIRRGSFEPTNAARDLAASVRAA